MPTFCPTYHVPVLLRETVDGLDVKPDGVYVDVTFGGGGHSREILSRLGCEGRLFSFDQDADAEQNVPADESRLTFVRSNFRYLTHWMRYHGQTEGVDGVLADLGVSSHHFDAEERGFSFRFDAPLDMRMNGRGGETAAQVLNTRSEEDLAKIFQLYGELKNGRRLAAAIVARRQEQAFSAIDDLLQVVKPMMPRDREKKDLARVFQALRIEVNHEMVALEEMLRGALRCLKPGGRLSVLTYHSLEDRMVKNFMRSGNVEGKVEQDFFGNRLSPLRPINNKVIVPSPEEQSTNPRSRSAKLRIAEKVAEKKP
ncbi:16S rRNA (cytosine(1402)-N(4))-methyltransferase RsmH [Alloprevotella sp. Lung230]|uniref:16S rRNA (cytosine(1402)-N(4))-methyltransferase RsmH n=1 Tax=Alloprevotella sp. Lung230 TaxID=2766595 RepID=UPI0016567973|nr:16S rRNA (cytosine(1402)-N(4))-methyltransferase RsmH [Alloprevotella sp. Lung230]MBC8626219.1 16S rRNA (cytosine(1402)-N(4))-methyltransferase RsmH [Alloprevotella sp. Lung230]